MGWADWKGQRGKMCVVCRIRKEKGGVFFANFPSDESRCRTWVKLVGIEDLVHVPIERLCLRRFVCGEHFTKKDFIRKGTRLKRTAIPSVGLIAPPLNEDQLREFPLHVASYKGPRKTENSESCNKVQSTLKIDNTADDVTTPAPSEHPWHKPPEFSWHRPSEAIPCADDVDIQTDVSPTAPDFAGGENENRMRQIEMFNDRLHVGYKCNECSSEIVGYRYTCVQCCGVELCGACEASGAHPEHYVLRLPRPEPAGRLGGLLDTLRGLLVHLPLSQLDLDKIKKEEVEDPLFGLQPRTPVVPPEESDGFGPKGQEEKPVLEILPIDSTATDTDIIMTNTAPVQHQTNVNYSNKAAPTIQNSSPAKKLLLSVIRIKKPTEVKTILDSDVVKLSSSMGPVQIGVAPAGTSTGVGLYKACVTVPVHRVKVSRADVRMLGAKVTKSGARVTVPKVAIKLPRTGMTVPGAGVGLSGINVRGIGEAVLKADVRVLETKPGAAEKLPRTGVTVPGAGVGLSGIDVRRTGEAVLKADVRVLETKPGAAEKLPRTGVTVPGVGVGLSGIDVRRTGEAVLKADVRVLETKPAAAEKLPRTGVTVPGAGVGLSGIDVRRTGEAVLKADVRVLETKPGAAEKFPRTGVTVQGAGVGLSGIDIRRTGEAVPKVDVRVLKTKPGAAEKLPRTGVTVPGAGVGLSGIEVRGTGEAVLKANVRVLETKPGAAEKLPRTGVTVQGAGVGLSGIEVRGTGEAVLKADVRVLETKPGAADKLPRTGVTVPGAGVGLSGIDVRGTREAVLKADVRVLETAPGTTEKLPRTGVTVPGGRLNLLRTAVGASGVTVRGTGVAVLDSDMRVSGQGREPQ